ncbi:MAG: efflux transporter outer membrane subunit [Allosphingosinicella sp.]
MRLLAGLAPLLAAGCVMGPNYQKPEIAQPDTFRSAPMSSAEAASFADLPWWNVFQDPALASLIRTGLANNPDLDIAASRIEQARAFVGVVRSEKMPQVGYQAGAGGEKTVTPEENDIGTVSFGSITGALNASWELDVWGRIKRQTESARAHLLAQEEVRRAVTLTLVSDIAAGYFHLIQLDRELGIANESEDVFRKMHELFALRHEAGRDSSLPAERARALWDSSRARSADIRREIAQQENALSILTGGYPQAIQRGVPLTVQTMPETPVGLTTDLIRRRPDIRQAEQVMVGANAEIGVAVANFYPRIGLSTLLGFIGINAEGGLDGTFSFWRGAGGLAGPIFSGGRLESIYAERKAFWDEAVASYRKTILTAFQETSDALAAQEHLATRRTALEGQIQALRRSIDLATERYRGGRASYFEVLEAQQQLYPAEAELAQTQEAQLVAVVSLYKALGGGWTLPDGQTAAAPAGQ